MYDIPLMEDSEVEAGAPFGDASSPTGQPSLEQIVMESDGASLANEPPPDALQYGSPVFDETKMDPWAMPGMGPLPPGFGPMGPMM